MKKNHYAPFLLLLTFPAASPVQAQLSYTPISPCTFADSRFWNLSEEMAPGTMYDLKVVGDLSGQGAASNCGVPESARAIAAKLVVIGFSVESKGRLHLNAYPDDKGPAVMNFGTNLSDFDMSNSGIIPICNRSVDACPYDLVAELQQGGPVHAVFSVQGYFSEQGIVGGVLPPDSITGTEIAPGSITSGEIAPDSITSVEIAPKAVGSSEIKDGAVDFIHIADGAIKREHIDNNSVEGGDILANAVGSDQLQNNVTFGDATSDGFVGINSSVNGNIVQITNNSLGAGFIRTRRDTGSPAVVLSTTTNGAGVVDTYTNRGVSFPAIRLATNNAGTDGFLEVYNILGQVTAGINGSTGTVFGSNIISLRADPNKSDRMIRYSPLEGAEAAIYVRGHANLVGGETVVTFPDYFSALVSSSSITVSLTPRSTDSLGLAAVEVSAHGMRVAELHGGTGEYRFDFVAAGVRKGQEDFEIYQSAGATGKSLVSDATSLPAELAD